jgi:hypothetical protein
MRLGPIVARFVHASAANPGYLDIAVGEPAMATRTDCVAIAQTFPAVESGSTREGEDYRVLNRIFMAFPAEDCISIKLNPDVAHSLYVAEPETYLPHPDKSGDDGCSRVFYGRVDLVTLRSLIEQSWCLVAPRTHRDRYFASRAENPPGDDQ